MKKFKSFSILFALAIVILSGCGSSDDSPKALVNLILVDNPAKWDSVLVEIEGVDVEMLVEGRETSSQTFYLEYKTGDKVIRVSDLVAGRALVIGRDELPLGKIIGLKVRMGTEHTLFQGDKGYGMPLKEISNSIIALDADVDLESGLSYDIILDLDLEASVVQTSATPLTFQLSPIFSVIEAAGAGEISGRIAPTALRPVIYVIQGPDSISTHTNLSGAYLARVSPGNYSIYFDPRNAAYVPLLVKDLKVESALTTELEPITFVRKP